MEYFTNEIRKKNEALARNVELMSSIESEEDFKKAVDLVSVRFNEEFIKGLISEDQLNKSFDTLDEIVKSRPHKYIRREGTPGNYRYIYKEPKGGRKKVGESTTEKQFKPSSWWNGMSSEEKKNFLDSSGVMEGLEHIYTVTDNVGMAVLNVATGRDGKGFNWGNIDKYLKQSILSYLEKNPVEGSSVKLKSDPEGLQDF